MRPYARRCRAKGRDPDRGNAVTNPRNGRSDSINHGTVRGFFRFRIALPSPIVLLCGSLIGDDSEDGVAGAESVVILQDVVDHTPEFASRKIAAVPFGEDESVSHREAAIVLTQFEGLPSIRDSLEELRHDLQPVFHDRACATTGYRFRPTVGFIDVFEP